jgi:hypothetical protein
MHKSKAAAGEMWRKYLRNDFFAARFFGLICAPQRGIFCGAASPSPDDMPYVF